MTPKVKATIQYALERLKEPSSWAGIASLGAIMHIRIPPGQVTDVIALGTVVAGIAAFAMKDGA